MIGLYLDWVSKTIPPGVFPERQFINNNLYMRVVNFFGSFSWNESGRSGLGFHFDGWEWKKVSFFFGVEYFFGGE